MNEPILLARIPWDAQGIFKNRPNRYLGIVDIIQPTPETDVKVHIHDPGRLKELLFPGNQVLLQHKSNPQRKTRWDVIAARIDNEWVLIHSGFHRTIANQILLNAQVSPFPSTLTIKPEVAWEKSRLDFLLTDKTSQRIWIEVKGCTLAQNKVALFPDAPTKRGCRHLKTLMSIKASGAQAALLILIFRSDATQFRPNAATDPEFARLFYQSINQGIVVHPMVLQYSGGQIFYLKQVPVGMTEAC